MLLVNTNRSEPGYLLLVRGEYGLAHTAPAYRMLAFGLFYSVLPRGFELHPISVV